jgi:hypothetical protein
VLVVAPIVEAAPIAASAIVAGVAAVVWRAVPITMAWVAPRCTRMWIVRVVVAVWRRFSARG